MLGDLLSLNDEPRVFGNSELMRCSLKREGDVGATGHRSNVDSGRFDGNVSGGMPENNQGAMVVEAYAGEVGGRHQQRESVGTKKGGEAATVKRYTPHMVALTAGH